MNKAEVKSQAQAMIKEIDTLMERLGKARTEEYEMRIGFEKKEREITDLGRDKIMSYSEGMEELKDPKTGRPNKEWSQFVLDKKLSEDVEYVEVMAGYYQYQQALAEAQSKVILWAEKIGLVKAQANLLAAVLRHLSSD